MIDQTPQAPRTAIYIDADACPVRDEVYRVATRLGLTVYLVANGSRPIRPPDSPNVSLVMVDDAMDAADDWIVAQITPVDLCVTNDIPLAARCIDRGAAALSFTGRRWTEANIGNALAGREVSRHLRELGALAGAHKTFSKADRSHFLEGLDAIITAIRRKTVAKS